MKIKIFQIDMSRDVNRVAFESYDNFLHYNHSKEIDNQLYNKVYEMEAQNATLNDIYEQFNINHSTDFKGHSLSVSDIIQTDDKFYYVESIGFKEIDFNPDLNVKIVAASISNYKDMVALFDSHNNIYLGKSDNYTRANYNNNDNSLTFISNNKKIFGMLSSTGCTLTEKEALEKGVYTTADIKEFNTLKNGVLKEFVELKKWDFEKSTLSEQLENAKQNSEKTDYNKNSEIKKNFER